MLGYNEKDLASAKMQAVLSSWSNTDDTGGSCG